MAEPPSALPLLRSHLNDSGLETRPLSVPPCRRRPCARPATIRDIPPDDGAEVLTLARRGYREHIALPADISRLARALHRRLFPLLGGRGLPIEKHAQKGETLYHYWLEPDMKRDVIRLVDQLEKLINQRACLLFTFRLPSD